jgi:hypothetical protein
MNWSRRLPVTNRKFEPYRVNPEVDPIIRELFKLANRAQITRKDLALKSGVTETSIGQWEKGARGRVDLVDACFQALGYRLSYSKNAPGY